MTIANLANSVLNRVVKSTKNSAGAADQAKAKEAKKELLIAKQLQEEELRILFNEGITSQFGKKKTDAQSLAKEMGIANSKQEVLDLLETFSDEVKSPFPSSSSSSFSSSSSSSSSSAFFFYLFLLLPLICFMLNSSVASSERIL